jgi:hypothetical protein
MPPSRRTKGQLTLTTPISAASFRAGFVESVRCNCPLLATVTTRTFCIGTTWILHCCPDNRSISPKNLPESLATNDFQSGPPQLMTEAPVEASVLRNVNEQSIAMAAKPRTEDADQALGLKTEIELSTVWMDSKALKVSIHFPVDWVLLRDATVTLMQATDLIRRHRIKHRMAEPKGLIKTMNHLSMQMTSVRRKPDSKRLRKKCRCRRRSKHKKDQTFRI